MFSIKRSIIVATLLALTFGVNAEGGLKVEKKSELNASPDTVWKMIGDYNHLDVWHPVVVNSTVNDNGNNEGTVRVLTLADGATITEKLVAHSDSKMTYTYAITKSPLPISDYVSTINVSTSGEGKSLVTWSSTFNANGVEDQKAMEIIAGIYDAGLGNLTKHFTN